MSMDYLSYRCPLCKSERCGNDANAGWDPVTQKSILLGEFDSQWCSECGDVTLEEFRITDPIEIARIDRERAILAIRDAAPALHQAITAAADCLAHLPGSQMSPSVELAKQQIKIALAAAEARKEDA